jgi:hypothetical protein
MIKASDLEFNTLNDPNTPELMCNMCNKKGGQGFLYADIKIAADATFSVILCSRQCERNFKNHKFVDDYLEATNQKNEEAASSSVPLKKMG